MRLLCGMAEPDITNTSCLANDPALILPDLRNTLSFLRGVLGIRITIITLFAVMFPWQQVDEEAESTRPKGHIEWLKDGEVIVTEGTKKYRQYRKKGLLQINNIGCGDQGVYECRYNSSRWGEAGRTELHSK